MIPVAQITQWRNIAPWPDNMQVEQDLILSRVLIEIFSDILLHKELAFRGGTALHKLFLHSAARYSEDIDLVRTSTGPINHIVDALRSRIDPWLGKPKREPKEKSFKLKYYFQPENSLNIKQQIKIEINTRECFSCFDRSVKNFSVQSDWYSGKAQINTFQLEELMATKLRALYQRRKGRDVFDLWLILKNQELDVQKIVQAFEYYMQKEGNLITRKMFLENLHEKLQKSSFMDDIGPLLSPDLKTRHNAYRITKENDHRITEDGLLRATEENWNLVDATEEIKEKILIYLPN